MTLEYISFFVGAGFPDESMETASKLNLNFIGADAGSIDNGPYQLAGQGSIFSDSLCRYDLRRALLTARAKDIPFIIGSCGGAGTDAGVDWFAKIIREIAKEEGLAPFSIAKIYSEIDRDLLCQKIRDKKIHPLSGAAPPYTEEHVKRSTCIAGVMGVEPFIAALEDGADVILAGRTTDSAIFASSPLRQGYPAAISWHAAKVAECGGAIAEPARNDLLHVQLTHNDFTVSPLSSEAACTPWSVAAHQLYENADPTQFVEPGGTIDASKVLFEVADQRSVKISGAKFKTAKQYTIKLEGVEPSGYQSIAMASYNDPVLLEEFPAWLERVKSEIDKKITRVFKQSGDDAHLTIHTYGAGNASDLFGLYPISTPQNDIMLLVDVIAPTQEIATSVATLAWHTLIHFPPSGWSGSFVNAACPFNPPVIDRGLTHRFNVNHVIEVDDPLDIIRIEHEEIK